MTEQEKHKQIMDVLEKQNEMLKGIVSRQDKHEQNDDIRFNAIPSTSEIEVVVEDTLKRVLFGVGRGTYFWIKVVAVVITSLAVIGGGAKWMLIWLGYNKI